jgi:hypothetical protein
MNNFEQPEDDDVSGNAREIDLRGMKQSLNEKIEALKIELSKKRDSLTKDTPLDERNKVWANMGALSSEIRKNESLIRELDNGERPKEVLTADQVRNALRTPLPKKDRVIVNNKVQADIFEAQQNELPEGEKLYRGPVIKLDK